MKIKALWLAGFVFALLCCFVTAEKAPRAYAHIPTAVHTTNPSGAAREAGVYDVRAFGANGDGKTLDTPAINRAISTGAAKGGGTVRFPAGTYLSVSIHLKSNIALYSPFDDAICPKSSFALGYARATENATITNCQVSGYDEGTFLNGTFKREYNKYSHSSPTARIKFGTESNGGFRNITISNCVFDYSRGFALESVDGGFLEDVTITNITMRDVVNSPFFLRLGNRGRGPSGTMVGQLRRVLISNVIVYNADAKYGSIISGIPGHPIEDVKFDNCFI